LPAVFLKIIFQTSGDYLQRRILLNTPLPIEAALVAAGDLLRAGGDEVSVVVVGGATMNLLGIVRRSTNDIDVIARAFRDEQGVLRLSQAEAPP
jgi:hypothetical protein